MKMKYQEDFVKRKTRIIKFGIMAGLLIMEVTACKRRDGNAVNMSEKDPATSIEYIWEEKDYSSLEYTTSYFTNPDDFKLHSVTTKMETTGVGNRLYGFMPEISAEERIGCIEATEVMLGRIGFDGNLSIYVYTSEACNDSFYIDEKDKGNTLLVYETDWQSPEYVAGLLLATCGRYSNYGINYGYADYLCENVWKNKSVNTTSELNAEYNGYDLNLLCFDEDFVTVDEIKEAKEIAEAFTRDYIDKNGEASLRELLKKSGQPGTCGEFNDELGKWYNDNGFEPNNSLSEVLYTYGGYSYQYIVYNRYAVFYMTRDWQDAVYEENPLLTADFLHNNYEETKKFYEINTEQMKQYKELFDLESDVMDVPVLFKNGKNSSTTGNGVGNGKKCDIYLTTVNSLMHEYIHALCLPTSPSNNVRWTIEGWARAFDMRFNYYSYDFLTMDYNKAATDNDKHILREYIEKIGRPIDMKTDYRDVDNLRVYEAEMYDPDYSYESGASFVYYLCDTYGERKVIDYVCVNHDLTTVTDKTYEELVEDWKNDMEERYSVYQKNN